MNVPTKITLTNGTVAIGTDPLISDASHLPNWVIITGNRYDVTVTCHLHAGLHCGIDTADHCSRDVTKYTIKFDTKLDSYLAALACS